jgi:hypothetical protein
MEADERPFDLSGGGVGVVRQLVKKLLNYKANKLYKKLNKETESLAKIHDSILSKTVAVDNTVKKLLLDAFKILNIVINSDIESNSDNSGIQREREEFFSTCLNLKKEYLSIRELEKEFYKQFTNAKQVDDLVIMINKKKLDASKAKYESSSKSPKRLFTSSKYGAVLGTNPIIEDIAARSEEATLAAKTNKINNLKEAVEKALKNNLFTGNFLISDEDLNSNSKYNESISKIKALLDGGDNTIYEIFCDEEKIKLLIRYYYFKNSGNTDAIIKFEAGENSIIFPDIPIVLQYFFHNFNKSNDAKCFVTQKLFSDPKILASVSEIKGNLLKKLKSLFVDINSDISDIFNRGISYSLLFHSVLYSKNVNSIKILLGSMIMTAMDLINNNNDIGNTNDISVIIEKYILKFEYKKILLMCWDIFTSSSINISTDYLRLVFYKLLDTSEIPTFLNLKDDQISQDFFKKSEDTRFNQQLDLLKSLDLQSTDIFMLTDVSKKSVDAITKEFSDSYHNINHGYHLGLLKKNIKKDNISILENVVSSSDYFITRAILNGQQYLLINLYIPFMKTTLDERNTTNNCENKLSGILRSLAEHLKGKDNIPIIIFASLNYNFIKRELPSDIKRESDNGGEHHIYLDFGAGAFQIIELPPSIYYFDYNIINCIKENKHLLGKILDEKERNQNLDYLFYKFPESMKDFKIHIKSPFRKTYNVIIEGKKIEKEGSEESETSDGYITVEDTDYVNSEESSEEPESASTIFTSSYTEKSSIDSKIIINNENIAKYNNLCEEVKDYTKNHDKYSKALADKTAELESIKRQIDTTDKAYNSKYSDLKALLPNIFEEVTVVTPSKTLTLTDDNERKELLDAIIAVFDANDVNFEKERRGGKDLFLKTNKSNIRDYLIKLKNTYNDQLKSADFRKLYNDERILKENRAKILPDAALPKEIAELEKQVKDFNDEAAKKKADFKLLDTQFNNNKLTAENWNFVEKQPSNHQLCAIEIIKKDAKISLFEKDIVPKVKKILEENKISIKDFKIYSSTMYNKFLYLSSIFGDLRITAVDGIDIEKYINSIINLYLVKDKKLYNPDDFKLKNESISVGMSGGKVESPKRNILIKVLNPKTIDYSNLKLKRRTNKRRLGKVYKNSRRRHSKHKARSKRN